MAQPPNYFLLFSYHQRVGIWRNVIKVDMDADMDMNIEVDVDLDVDVDLQ
jgi:hypothetical protein